MPGERNEKPIPGITYRGVIYNANGSISITKAHPTQAEAFAELMACMARKRIHDRSVRTTVIKRQAAPDELIFGTPRSLDARSRFDALLKKGLAEFEEE